MGRDRDPGRPRPVVTRGEVTAALVARLGSAAEARWLVEDVLGPPIGRAGAGETVPEPLRQSIEAKVQRRQGGEPLQYVLGCWAFRTLDLLVDPRVLIPRPETEQVVEVALGVLGQLAARGDDLVVCDLGTGSGAIALSIAAETAGDSPTVLVWATDREPGALEVAALNRDRVGMVYPGAAERVRLRRGEWFAALPASLNGGIDLVVSNPPYVAVHEWADLDPEVQAEPRSALVAGDGVNGTPGLADVEQVLTGAALWLARPGAVVIEIAPHQAPAADALAHRLGFSDVRVTADLAGRDRVLVGWVHR